MLAYRRKPFEEFPGLQAVYISKDEGHCGYMEFFYQTVLVFYLKVESLNRLINIYLKS